MSDAVTNIVGPGEPGGIVYTIKGGAGFDAPWLVVRGSTAVEVSSQVADLTGLDPTAYETVFEFLVAADVHVKAVIAATGIGAPAQKSYGGGQKSGGKPASSGFPAKASTPAADQPPAEDGPPPHEFQQALDLIAQASSQKEVNGIYVNHKAAFANADVLKAAEERVNALKAAG